MKTPQSYRLLGSRSCIKGFRRSFRALQPRNWTKRAESEIVARQLAVKAIMRDAASSTPGHAVDYKSWSQDSLIERVTQLEQALKEKATSYAQATQGKQNISKPRHERKFDPSRYNTRLIALKLAYLGKNYNGFEHHVNNKTPLPTIEEEIWKALNKAKLIFPVGTTAPGEINWEGCEYSKCGRTDKGVSAFGQVIGVRVRSNKPFAMKRSASQTENPEAPSAENGATAEEVSTLEISSIPREHVEDGIELDEEFPEFDPVVDEIQYATLLNRLLPPDIRILAWCPFPPEEFSARFSCRERQYRYFFTQPAFTPTPTNLEDPSFKSSSSMKDGWLDIAAMRHAAKQFEGLHDFRNFCKVDPGKQITNFERRIFFADIEEVTDTTGALAFVNSPEFLPNNPSGDAPKVYTFTLHGSAFLWHQVRHMVAILFLVGQGLEPSDLISQLLDVDRNPCRPVYEMASDTPLVLWNCVFPDDDDPDRKDILQWHYVGSGPGLGETKYGTPGLVEDLWKVWRERKIDEVLAASLLEVVSKQGDAVKDLTASRWRRSGKSQKVFDGGDKPLLKGSYLQVMKKPRMESVTVQNERYAVRKGFESSADMKEQGFRRLNGKVETGTDG